MNAVETSSAWIFWRAGRLTLATLLTWAIVHFFNIPFGMWAILTVLIVAQIHLGESIRKGLHRLYGTLLGCVAGILVGTYAIHYHWAFAYILPIWVFLTWYCGAISYAWSMFFGMLLLASIFFFIGGAADYSPTQVIGLRMINIVIGVLINLLVGVIFHKSKTKDILRSAVKHQWKNIYDLITLMADLIKKEPLDITDIKVPIKESYKEHLQIQNTVTLVLHEPERFHQETKSLQIATVHQRRILDLLSSLLLLFELSPRSKEETQSVANDLLNIVSNTPSQTWEEELEKMIVQHKLEGHG
ncbi:FUSC family protein [Simkania negevensis]|uniref:FUSC family protein n=1 Tax=Simkania negevensis TaxID=83561 RepID=A0ABS3ARG4_9BACT|nr:FUSC family protein [Simkania negevensis]